jgi:hypothetical protein
MKLLQVISSILLAFGVSTCFADTLVLQVIFENSLCGDVAAMAKVIGLVPGVSAMSYTNATMTKSIVIPPLVRNLRGGELDQKDRGLSLAYCNAMGWASYAACRQVQAKSICDLYCSRRRDLVVNTTPTSMEKLAYQSTLTGLIMTGAVSIPKCISSGITVVVF